MRSTSLATAVAVAAGSVALVGGAAAPAAADTRTNLPLASYGDMVVDSVHSRLFISDRDANRILVTDFAGAVQATLPGLPQVQGLALSADSSTLYAAVPGADKIVAVDAGQLTETASYPTGTGTKPSDVAVGGGKVWFGYGENWDTAEIGSLDLTTETPTVSLELGIGQNWSGAPSVYTDPDLPDTVVAVDGHISSAPVVVYDVSTGTPAVRTQKELDGFIKNLAFTPDNQRFVAAGNFATSMREFSLADLSAVASYPGNYTMESVAIAPDGTVAGGSTDRDNVGDVYVYPGGAGAPAASRNLFDGPLDTDGVAWSPDGSRLFVVSDDPWNATGTLAVIDQARRYPVTATVEVPSTATRAKALTVKGRISTALALPSGAQVAVTRTDGESPSGKSLGLKTLAADGSFSFADTPLAGGKATYKVSYAGDDQHFPATASGTVSVSYNAVSLALYKYPTSTVSYGATVKFRAHLGSTYKNRTVAIYQDRAGDDKGRLLVKSGTVNSSGDLTAYVKMYRDTSVYAVFTGDSRTAAKTVKVWVPTRVSVKMYVNDYYKTAYTGGHTYYYIHDYKDPVLSTAMTAYPGRSQRVDMQIYASGAWHSVDPMYVPLNSSGKSYVKLEGDWPNNYKLRARSVYVDGSSGDSVNATTYSSWKYFIFTS
ncbi:Ig-like domain repeat protein [Streptomyces sp. NPDC051940]|uniref:WD40 repeat domain-containing protein n=1 Tax=Streptomyces sp. NPDC051940 TaxID=3155675 RepID=UPI003433C77E